MGGCDLLPVSQTKLKQLELIGLLPDSKITSSPPLTFLVSLWLGSLADWSIILICLGWGFNPHQGM